VVHVVDYLVESQDSDRFENESRLWGRGRGMGSRTPLWRLDASVQVGFYYFLQLWLCWCTFGTCICMF
jgi:hypothetical protein